MKRIIVACSILWIGLSMTGCCKTLEQAVRANTEDSDKLAKVVYTSNIADELKKEMVLNYAALRCTRDILDKQSTSEKDSAACACQRYGGGKDFSKCTDWFGKQ